MTATTPPSGCGNDKDWKALCTQRTMVLLGISDWARTFCTCPFRLIRNRTSTLPSSLGFVFNAAYVGGLMMAIYTPTLLWMNLRHLPRCARPAWPNVVMLVVASMVYVGFAVYSLGIELGLLR